jgi:hypothetical protein
MARLRILAAAASYQRSLAYTITLGHIWWKGVGKARVMVGMTTAPDTVNFSTKLTASMVMMTVDQALRGMARNVGNKRSSDTPEPDPM